MAESLIGGFIEAKGRLTGQLAIGTVIGDNNSTYILVDEEGNEIPAVLVDEETILTATANDIRLGSVAVTDDGVVVGEKYIPAYFVNEGQRIIRSGTKFVLPTPYYDYAKFQALLCPFNTTVINSVYTDRVVINNSVYDVQSTEPISGVIKDDQNSGIDLGITNESGAIYLIRYFMYTEV